MNYSDYKHTHAIGRPTKTRIIQGKVIKDGSNGSRKVIPCSPEKQQLSPKGQSFSGKPLDSKWEALVPGCTKINGAIVGGPSIQRAAVPGDVKKELKIKRRQQSIEKKLLKLQETIESQEQEQSSEVGTMEIEAPDGSTHKIDLDNTYPL